MVNFKNVNGVNVEISSEEQTVIDKETKEWTDQAPKRRMINLRNQRNDLLSETDWMGNQDVTISAAWTTYRQALRDITTQTPADDALSNITFPTKPTE